MKVTLVVASGVHEGKTIPINAAQFLIGRDPQCQLRPASQAVSKQHCAILVRNECIFIKDYGSTNGTNVNDEIVRNEEREVKHGDRVKVGPLDFTLRVEGMAVDKPVGSVQPDVVKKKAQEAVAAVQSVIETAAAKAASSETPGRKTPAPKPDSKSVPSKATAPKAKAGDPSNDDIAAMLLGMTDDDPAEKVPEGSTVMEIPTGALPPEGNAAAAPGPSKPAPAKAPTREETSNAASEILRKMLRRPR